MRRFTTALSLSLAVALLAPLATVAQSAPKKATAATNSHSDAALAERARGWIVPFSTVYANVKFTDDGTTLTVSGRGDGFNPGLSYTSFFGRTFAA